jgi:glycosyltransferase involved in cell wall biosynthesis
MTGPEPGRPAALVAECELSDGIAPLIPPRGGIEALLLIRLFTEPIGMLELTVPRDGLSETALAAEIARAFGPALRDRFEECGLAWTDDLPTTGLRPPRHPAFLASRERVLGTGPDITVAICTHDRPDTLATALQSVCTQSYERLRVVVVDNAPSDDRARQVVASFAERYDVTYALEPRPGLSWARNRAIEYAHDVLAWVDDDETCDEWWAAEIARGFVEVPSADAVTGAVVPSELETPSQLFFERYGSVRRHRGFARAVFSPATRELQSPLYPLPPFGIGANMAFRRSALERIGGFDCALGAGTLTQTAEDTAAFTALLLSGGTIVYQPTSIVRHQHRRDDAVLHELLRGHGRGLGAFYTSMLLRRPSCAGELIRLLPAALRDQFSPAGKRADKLSGGIPAELVRANRMGIVQGPFVYARARARARRLRAGAPTPALPAAPAARRHGPSIATKGAKSISVEK